jgi:hypothetical protein
VLPLVVFDEGGANLPSRYVSLDPRTAKEWTVDKALTAGEHWQYHVLNIAGARLRADAGTSVDLIAYDDGTPQGKAIAEKRVASVRDYLHKTFGLADKQVTMSLRNGQSSQQPWVFVVDTTRRVLAPIQATETVTETQLPRVRIAPDVVSEAGLRAWTLTMSQADRSVYQDSGTGKLPATLIWDMNESLKADDAFATSVAVQLRVMDMEGALAQSEPGLVTIKGSATQDKPIAQQTRTEVLRWIGADYLYTPDVDVFGVSPSFDRIDVYPSASRRSDYFIVEAPATVHPVGATVWFREGLQVPERSLFDHAEVYTRSLP